MFSVDASCRITLDSQPMGIEGDLRLPIHTPPLRLMLSEQTPDPVRQHALTALIAAFITQGHPTEYAKHMATAAIFQTDLELRNAQLSHLLGWLKQEHSDVYQDALTLLENTREEFERRVQTGS